MPREACLLGRVLILLSEKMAKDEIRTSGIGGDRPAPRRWMFGALSIAQQHSRHVRESMGIYRASAEVRQSRRQKKW
jgi:hypothetical protein